MEILEFSILDDLTIHTSNLVQHRLFHFRLTVLDFSIDRKQVADTTELETKQDFSRGPSRVSILFHSCFIS